MESSRHTKKTLYVVAGFYVVVGFVLAVASAIDGDRLGTFLGFLIVSGALCGAALLRTVLRLGQQIAAISETLDHLADGPARLEDRLRHKPHEAEKPGDVRMIDLSRFGDGDPSVLTAATLDRSVFPRLVTTMSDTSRAPSQRAKSDGVPSTDAGAQRGGPGTKDLLRRWKVALRSGDLGECRAILSTLVDVADPVELDPLRAQIEALADRTERALRRTFADRVHEHDLAAALAVGEQIIRLLPDRPVADGFRRIEPHLARRVREAEADTSARTLAH